jgi:hypothetical protein
MPKIVKKLLIVAAVVVCVPVFAIVFFLYSIAYHVSHPVLYPPPYAGGATVMQDPSSYSFAHRATFGYGLNRHINFGIDDKGIVWIIPPNGRPPLLVTGQLTHSPGDVEGVDAYDSLCKLMPEEDSLPSVSSSTKQSDSGSFPTPASQTQTPLQ